MSSKYSATPLSLDIRPSRLIAMLVLVMHVAVALACAQLPVSLLARLVLLLAVIGSLMCNGVLYRRRTPKRLSWSQEQGWHLLTRDSKEYEMELLPDIYLGAWILVLHFRDAARRKHTVLLAQDSARADSLRRLRVLLRYGMPRQ